MIEHDFLIGSYDESTVERYENIADMVEEEYPSILAESFTCYVDNMTELEYAQALKSFMDIFELSIQFVCSFLFHKLRDLNVQPAKLKDIAQIFSQKPLSTGDWFERIFRDILKVALEFDIELAHSFESKYRKKNGKLTEFGRNFNRIPNFRNTHIGHDTGDHDDVARKILLPYESCLFEFLDALSPLQNFAVFTLNKALECDACTNKYTIRHHVRNIKRPNRIETEAQLLHDGFYLVEKTRLKPKLAKEDIISLPPLVVYTYPPNPDDSEADSLADSRITYVFQSTTNKATRLSYVTAEGKPKKITDNYTNLFVSFIQYFIDTISLDLTYRKKIAPSTRSWDDFYDLAKVETQKFIGNMSSKYNRNLFVPRKEMNSAFHQFLDSEEKNGLVLLGESGIGKTNLICNFAESLLAQGDAAGKYCVVVYYSKLFANVDLAEQILETFESDQSLPNLLKELNQAAESADKHIIFMFDAINECIVSESDVSQGSAANLLNRIDSLLVAKRYSRIKVVMSCRNYTWEETRKSQGYGINPDHYFTTRDFLQKDEKDDHELCLKGFTVDEFSDAYQKYADHYSLQTPLETILSRKFQMQQLRAPIRLKLVAECYKGAMIPANRVDSIELLERQFDEVVAQVAGVDSDESNTVLWFFTKVLWNRNADALPLHEIKDAEPPRRYENEPDNSFYEREGLYKLKTRLFKESGQYTTTLSILLDKGILRVEKGTSFHELRFVHERIHEFLLAKVMTAEIDKKSTPDLVDFFENELLLVKDYAVIWGAIRNALIMNLRNRANSEVIRLISGSSVYGAQGIVNEVVNYLAQEDYETAFDLLKDLIRTPAEYMGEIEKLDQLDSELSELRKKARLKKTRKKAEIRALINELEAQRRAVLNNLKPVIKAKKAAIKSLYDVYRTVFYKNDLYQASSPLDLLWEILADPLDIIRNTATRYLYYLWTELPDTAFSIFEKIKDNYLKANFFKKYGKQLRKSHLEPSGRFSILIACESLINNRYDEQLETLQEIWQEIIYSLSLRGTALPIVQPIMRHLVSNGLKVISAYVNNLTEFQHFWDTIPKRGNGYTQEDFKSLVRFLNPGEPGFEEHCDTIVSGAELGDAFNNLLLERLLIAQGVADYGKIAEVVDRIYTNENNQLPEYTQMSMLYVIFHTLDKMPSVPEDAFLKYQEYMMPWTEKTKGYFKAWYHEEANEGRLYKQYTLNWYGALHSKLYGDGKKEMTLFNHYIKKGFETGDTHLFVYAVENIAMLAADFGFWRSALNAFEYTLSLFESNHDFMRFKKAQIGIENGYNFDEYFDVRTYLAKTLATIRGYFGREVDRFIRDELSTTSFPEFERFREDLLRFEASENIGDLLTHKIGNLWVQCVVNIDGIRKEIIHLLEQAPEAQSAKSWLTLVVQRMLNIFVKV